MYFRTKLILSNLAMVLVPLAVILLSSMMFWSLVQDKSSTSEPSFFPRFHSSSFKEAIMASRQIMNEIDDATLTSQEITEAQFKDWTHKLHKSNSHLVIYYDNKRFYPLRSEIQHLTLPEYYYKEDQNQNHDDNNPWRILEHKGFMRPNHQKGEAVIYWNSQPWEKELADFSVLQIISFSITIILLNLIFTWFLSRGILKPLDQIKITAELIAQGELESPLPKNKRKDELAPLFSAFEQMRQQLLTNKKIQQKYEDSRKELIAHIAHDLRTPITAIIGYVQGILEGVAATPEKQQAYLLTISSKAKDLEKMAQELFFFSSLDVNAIPFTFQKINAQSFFLDLSEEMALDYESQGMIFDPPEPPSVPIYIDVLKMRKVFVNLADNAIKFRRGKIVTWQWNFTLEPDYLRIEVIDNGKGISPQAIDHVFERFYREDSARTSRVPGSGLGLAIVKHIMNGHQGLIQVESEVEKGTTFILRLPLSLKEGLDEKHIAH